VTKNIVTKSPRDLSKKLCSYVLLEIDREKLDKIYPVLRLNENVVIAIILLEIITSYYWSAVIIFRVIDKFIESKIVNLDGVLKVKRIPGHQFIRDVR